MDHVNSSNAGAAPPGNETPPIVAATGGADGQVREVNGDCGAGVGAEQAEHAAEKAFDTMRARLARRGVELRRVPSGGYLAHSWAYSRTLANFEAVEAFALQVAA